MISALDSVAWTLNIRGERRRPHACRAVLPVRASADGTADWFIAPDKVSPEVAQALGNAVRIRPRDEFSAAFEELAGKRVAADPAALGRGDLPAAGRRGRRDRRARTIPPCCPRRSRPPPNSRAIAMHRRATAWRLRRFLHWLSVEAPTGEVDELAAAAKLHELRQAEQRPAARPFFRHDQRRRPQRRQPALPRGRGKQPRAGAEQRLPGRFRAGSIPMARPTSPAPSGPAPMRRPPRCATASPAC